MITNQIIMSFQEQLPFMLSSSPKRARHVRLWHRIIETRERQPPIIIHESPSVVALKKIRDLHTDELNMSEAELKRLDAWINGLLDRTRYSSRITYDQNSYARYASSHNYKGSIYLGRMFPRHCGGGPIYRSQSLKKVVRNTLYHSSHVDIDIVNCHPVIAVWLFDHLPIPTLKDYTNRRDEILHEMGQIVGPGDVRGIPPAMVKKIVAAIMNNAGSSYGLYGPDTRYAKMADQVAFFSGLRKDKDSIVECMHEIYPDFMRMTAAMAADSQSTNATGKAISILLQDVENQILRCMVAKIQAMFRGRQLDDIILMFDGLMLPRDLITMDDDQFLGVLVDAVKEKIGISIQLAYKSLEPYFEDCVVDEEPEVTRDAAMSYDQWKEEFEKDHYRLEFPTCYAKVGRHQTAYHNLNRFKTEVCAEEVDDYVKEWIKDKTKRKYEREEFAPPPHTLPDDELNTYTGMRAESLIPVDDDHVQELVEPLLYHLKLLCGGVKANTEYVINWMARRVQCPGVLPLVGLGFRSVEGTGKDSFFSFFGNQVIGKKYFTQAPELSSIFADKHSMALKDKLLVVISECTRGDTNSVRQKMKSFMTATTVKFRPLYVDEMYRANYCGVVMFGQDQQFMNLDGDDRRFIVMDSLPIHANDPVYFSKFIPMLDKDEVARAFYQYLMARDVTNFKPSADRPMTMARENMVGFSARPFYVFLKQFIPEQYELHNPSGAVAEQKTFTIMRPVMYEYYEQFVKDVYPKYADDIGQKRKFMSEVRTLVNDSIVQREDKSIYYPFKMIKYQGSDGIKIDCDHLMKFLKKYVPDDETQDIVDLDL